MSRLKYLLLTIPLLAVAVTIWHLLYHNPALTSDPFDPPVEEESAGEGVVITGIRLVQFDGVRTQWTLEAPRARYHQGRQTVVETPVLTVFRKNGDRVMVTSKEGVVEDDTTRRMTFKEQVVVADSRDRKFTTELLRFHPGKSMLSTDRPFQLEEARMRLEGVGLILFHETRWLKVLRHVRVAFPEYSLERLDEA